MRFESIEYREEVKQYREGIIEKSKHREHFDPGRRHCPRCGKVFHALESRDQTCRSCRCATCQEPVFKNGVAMVRRNGKPLMEHVVLVWICPGCGHKKKADNHSNIVAHKDLCEGYIAFTAESA